MGIGQNAYFLWEPRRILKTNWITLDQMVFKEAKHEGRSASFPTSGKEIVTRFVADRLYDAHLAQLRREGECTDGEERSRPASEDVS
jgi:hypothetical protein